jgi:hypothetical protein
VYQPYFLDSTFRRNDRAKEYFCVADNRGEVVQHRMALRWPRRRQDLRDSIRVM